ncbi:MAG: gluconolaconase [Actinobacteria bacterium HGW-Actinobacteria-5]|jgi:sugar lactone lactonase YvrE|nr:MAG: gluconolaconase [Actinobacteria bacterium HGW-Actinobacteria-5]
MPVLASGYGLLESPRWHAGMLWFADWTAGRIHRLRPDGRVEVMAEHASLPLCFDFLPDGTPLVVSAATCSLLALSPDGTLAPYADLRALSELGANDIVVDGRGNAWVNSPNAPFGSTAPEGGPASGRIALVSGPGDVRVVADDLDFPNGMAISPDNRTLIVAESYRQRLTAFTITADGSLTDRRVFADLGEDPPDGITIDATGAVWYADVPHSQCVRVAEGGTVLDRVEFDRGAFACMLGGTDASTLFVVGASWPGAAGLGRQQDWHGTVWSSPAPAPRAGWPSN